MEVRSKSRPKEICHAASRPFAQVSGGSIEGSTQTSNPCRSSLLVLTSLVMSTRFLLWSLTLPGDGESSPLIVS
jgi:hypothetical protein